MEWTDLNPFWDISRRCAEERYKQKNDFKSTRNWNKDPHFVGLLSEHVYGKMIGQEPNLDLLIQGDSGFDFPGVDVKGCTYVNDPYLKWIPSAPLVADTYVLVVIDLNKRRGMVKGYATRAEVAAAPLIDWGYGDRFSIQGNLLHTCEITDKNTLF